METHKDEITLKELFEKAKEWFQFLISQWKIIILFGIVGATLGLTYSIIQKPLYTASLTFALEEESSDGGIGGALGIASSLGLELGGGKGGSVFSGSNLKELFKSRKIVERTLMQPIVIDGDSISLMEFYLRFNGLKEKYKKNLQLKNLKFPPQTKSKYFTRSQDSIIGVVFESLIKKNLIIGPKEESSLTVIDFTSENELFAKVFCEELVEEVSRFYADTKSKKARINMAILVKQRDSIRAELNGGITSVAVANDNTFMLNPAMNVNKTTSAKKQIDVQSNTSILSELIHQTELAKVALRKETPLIQIIDPPILPLPKEKFGKSKGVFLGGVIAVFLSILGLSIKKLLRDFF
jgi:hypothetical protein